MSYPGQFVDPRQRPLSGMSAASTLYRNPSSARQQPFKEYGQDYQFTETWANPPPQTFVHPQQPYHPPSPSPVATPVPAPLPIVSEETSGPREGINAEVRDLFRDDEGSNSKEAGWKASKKAWYKRVENKWWIIGAITFGGILAVILAILGGIGVIGDHSSVSPSGTNTPSGELTTTRLPDGSSPTSSTTSITTPTGTASTTASRPTSTNVIKDCSNKDSYVPNLSFVGIKSAYTASYEHADTDEGCCKVCFGVDGCAGWYFDGSSQFTPCAQLIVNTNLGGADDTCPKGYSSTVFTKKNSNDDSGGTGGVGPCSNGISFG